MRTKVWSLGAGTASVVVVSCMASSHSPTASALTTSSLPPECESESVPLAGNPPQHPDRCHGNPNFEADGTAVMSRGDVAELPAPLRDQLTRLACRPHSTLPIQFFSEAETPSVLFQYYLLD